MTNSHPSRIELIPIDRINVLNPRVRNKRSFSLLVENIAAVGLKKPITLRLKGDAAEPAYELICGQGRLEAMQALGQSEIPAIVSDATTEDALVRSLVENCARRQHTAMDLLQDITDMQRRGHSKTEIAKKTGLTYQYVRDITNLLTKGEQRLIQAVESGQVPITVAVDIAGSDDAGVQDALRVAYEKKLLRGRKFMAVKALVEQRRRQGKGFASPRTKHDPALSPHALMRTYRQEADRKQSFIRKAATTRNRLVFITEALKTLLHDENFVTLLRAEGLQSFPRKLADRIGDIKGYSS